MCACVCVCMCVGTVWQGCQETTRRRTSAAQRPTTVCWKIWSSGRSTRSRWPPTQEQAWVSTAALSLSTHCREVSMHTFISQSKYTKSFWEVFNHCSICTLLNIKYCDTVELVTQEELFLGLWIFKYGPEKTSHQSNHTLWALTYEQTLCIM